jgi:hypothetical protein
MIYLHFLWGHQSSGSKRRNHLLRAWQDPDKPPPLATGPCRDHDPCPSPQLAAWQGKAPTLGAHFLLLALLPRVSLPAALSQAAATSWFSQ